MLTLNCLACFVNIVFLCFSSFLDDYFVLNVFPIQAQYTELSDNKPGVDDTLSGIDSFLREYKDRLGPEQQDLLQRGSYDLRSHFDQSNYKAQDWLRQMNDQVRVTFPGNRGCSTRSNPVCCKTVEAAILSGRNDTHTSHLICQKLCHCVYKLYYT